MLFATVAGLFVVGIAGLVYWSGQEGQIKNTASLNFPEREPPVVKKVEAKLLVVEPRKPAKVSKAAPATDLAAPATTQT